MAYLNKMKPKIISFPRGDFERKNQPPLTSSMIFSLLETWEKQKERIPFGPYYIKGCLSSLLTTGPIIRKEVTMNEQRESLAMLRLKRLQC